MKFLRLLLEVSVRDNVRSEEIKQKMGVDGIDYLFRIYREKWMKQKWRKVDVGRIEEDRLLVLFGITVRSV